MRSKQFFVRFSLLVLVIVAVLAGCSDQPLGPLGPAGEGPEAESEHITGPIAVRSDSLYDWYYKESVNADYTTLSETIAGAVGGEVKGVVSGYADTFRVAVPAGAFASSKEIRIDVPTSRVPVFHLLPGTAFSDTVTVTLDIKLWLDEGTLVHGGEYEIFYMNEATSTLDVLDPRAIFTADSTDNAVSFKTLHFSRWVLEGKTI